MRKRGRHPGRANGDDLDASEDIDDTDDTDEEEPIISSLDGAEHATRDSQWRWGLRLGGLVAVVALVAVIAVTLAPVIPYPAAPMTSPDFITLALPSELRFCAADGYWSPDGRQIAVARAPLCGISDIGVSELPDIYIYDAARGALIAEYRIMPTIQEALARADLSGAQVNFSNVTWSPDQRTLATQFEVIQTLPQSLNGVPIRGRPGVALVTVAGPHTGAVSALISPRDLWLTAEGAGYTPGPLAVDEWDTRQLSVRQLDLPAALEYEWLPGDLLIGADQQAPGDVGRIGIPNAGQRFSMWRTGYLVEVNPRDCGQYGGRAPARPKIPLSVLYLFTTTWSPDGRYLMTITQVARAPQAFIMTADASRLPLFCLSGPAASAFPQAPIHDRAVRATLGLFSGDVSNMELLWSPDGARLAALPSTSDKLSSEITLYNTATGAIVTRISAGPSEIPGAQGSDANALFINGAWSPDGRRLLTVVEGQQFNIRIYGPRALGCGGRLRLRAQNAYSPPRR